MTSRSRALWLTARPKTLSASVVPVLVAHLLAQAEGLKPQLWISLCAVFSAMMIQVGTNFINDALDFIKGADGETRLGEARATQQGWLTARGVMALGFGFFGLAIALGVPLVWQGGGPILVVGLVSVLMGYAYTGGPFPLAYIGLGDLFVVIFFGLVAVCGCLFLHAHQVPVSGAVAGLQIGLLATVLIAINNLRDLDQDREVGKRTLAVRLGPRLGRYEVVGLVTVSYGLGLFWLSRGFPWAFALPILASPVAYRLLSVLLTTQASREYNRLLARGALLHMLFGVLLSLGLYLA